MRGYPFFLISLCVFSSEAADRATVQLLGEKLPIVYSKATKQVRIDINNTTNLKKVCTKELKPHLKKSCGEYVLISRFQSEKSINTRCAKKMSEFITKKIDPPGRVSYVPRYTFNFLYKYLEINHPGRMLDRKKLTNALAKALAPYGGQYSTFCKEYLTGGSRPSSSGWETCISRLMLYTECKFTPDEIAFIKAEKFSNTTNRRSGRQ